MQGLRARYENYYQIRYTSDALKYAVELSARYISRDRQLPDKAIDVIDEARAYERLQDDQRKY